MSGKEWAISAVVVFFALLIGGILLFYITPDLSKPKKK